MEISESLLIHLEELSKLRLSEPEREPVKKELQQILAYMELLRESSPEQVEPLSHPLPLENVFREDDVITSVSPEAILSNAPETRDGCFLVPRTFESTPDERTSQS